jgi:hypothetical protein
MQSVRWEIETAQTLRYDAHGWANGIAWRASFRPAAKPSSAVTDTRSTTLPFRFSPLLRMASDQLDVAKREFEESRRRLPEGSFPLLDRLETCSGIDLDLYARNPAAARDRFESAWPRLAPMCRVWQNGRIEMLFYRARINLAVAAQTGNDTSKHEALRRRRGRRARTPQGSPVGKALAQLWMRPSRTPAATTTVRFATMRLAEASLETCHMNHYVRSSAGEERCRRRR